MCLLFDNKALRVDSTNDSAEWLQCTATLGSQREDTKNNTEEEYDRLEQWIAKRCQSHAEAMRLE